MMRDWLADRYPTVAQALVGYPWAIERSASPEAYDNVFHLPDVEPAAILAAVGVRVEP